MALKEDTLITLFIIDSGKSKSDVWGGRRYFVSSEETGGKPVDYVDEKQQVTTFTYSPIPIFFSGIEISGSNRLPRPKLSIANVDNGGNPTAILIVERGSSGAPGRTSSAPRARK